MASQNTGWALFKICIRNHPYYAYILLFLRSAKNVAVQMRLVYLILV